MLQTRRPPLWTTSANHLHRAGGPQRESNEFPRTILMRTQAPAPCGTASEPGRVAMQLERITHNPAVMGGKPCIRGLRVTVGTILGLLATGTPRERILQASL